MVKTCWRKLSCLLQVVAQKSSRLIVSALFARLARLVDDGDAALLAEGRIGQHQLVFAVLAGQRVFHLNGLGASVPIRCRLDAVEEEVHRAEPRDAEPGPRREGVRS